VEEPSRGSIRVEGVDHVGVIAAVIHDCGLMPMSNARLVPEAQDAITPGDAIAAMMLTGLGVAHRPLSWPPQVVASQPREWWLRAGMRAALVNRGTLGRPLDAASTYGGDRLVQERARAVGAHAGIDRRGTHRDTPSVSRSGEYVPTRDAPAMTIPPGDSRDHRPDLTPVGVARMVSQDGGVPWLRHSWDGQTAATQLFQARAQALMSALPHAPSPRSRIADAKLSHHHQAATLEPRGGITRSPHTLGAVSPVIRQALTADTWHARDEPTRDQRLAVCHDGLAQRWRVGHSPAASERAEATVTNPRQREEAAITPHLLHRQAQRCATPEMAHEALTAVARSWTSHQVAADRLSDHQREARQGRPAPHTPLQASTWPGQAHARPDQEALAQRQQRQAGGVLETNSDASAGGAPEVIHADPGQSRVEGGLRVRKAPRVCVASLWVKKPCRRHGVLLVRTRALWVYAVTPRRRRQPLAEPNETVPNPRHQPTMAPTVRGVFQRLAGLPPVRGTAPAQVPALVDGLTDGQLNVLRQWGEPVCGLDQISPG
jgi:transposase